MPLFIDKPDSAGEVLQANLGYYVVGKEFFFNTIDAYKHSNVTGEKVFHSFYDDVFIKAHRLGAWKNTSLSTLYSMRARQLRSQYDMLAVNFSGGWDSRNILDTFEAEGIQVDFILIWSVKGMLDKGVKGSRDPGNWITEVSEVAIPYAKEFCARNPKTKIIIVDKYTDKIVSDFTTKKDNSQEIFDISKQKPGIMYARNKEFQDDLDVQKALEGGKTACLISGSDKPFIRHTSLNNAVGMFPEQIHSKFKIPRRSEGYADNIVFESFYWTPYLPELAIRGWYEMYALATKDRFVAAATDDSLKIQQRVTILRSLWVQEIMKKMLYPQYTPGYWSVNKPKDCGFLVTVEVPVIKVLDERAPGWKAKLREIIQGTINEVGENNMLFFDDPSHSESFERSSELESNFTSDFFVKIKPSPFFRHPLDMQVAQQFANRT